MLFLCKARLISLSPLNDCLIPSISYTSPQKKPVLLYHYNDLNLWWNYQGRRWPWCLRVCSNHKIAARHRQGKTIISYASKSFYISISTIVFHITLSPNISPLYFLSINMHIFYPTNSIAVPLPISKFCLFFKNHSHVSSFEHSFIMFISRSISRLLRSSSHWEFFFHA